MDSIQITRVGVFCGGRSRESEISLRSGKHVQKALESLGYSTALIHPEKDLMQQIQNFPMDAAYLALHGAGGEDGSIQGFLETLGIPYTGSGVMASAVTMNKILTKMLLKANGLPTPEFQVITRPDEKIDLLFPLILKPQEEGSSFGVSIHEDEKSLRAQIEKDLKIFEKIFVERFIPSGAEVTVGVLGVGADIRALPVLELVPKNRFYDFEAKYTAGKTDFILPAKLEKSVLEQIQSIAVRAHKACGCHGVSRVDMMVENRIAPTITEINSIPGMTELSDLPAQAQTAGISFPDLVETILQSAISRA